MAKAFVDTNILVYQLDGRYPEKRRAARDAVRELAANHEAVISTQVLQEFYAACTTKLKIDPSLVKRIMHGFRNMEIVTIGTDLIGEAIDTSMQYRLSFWDSLVVVCAESAKCRVLLTEDLGDGQVIRGVRVKNPLT